MSYLKKSTALNGETNHIPYRTVPNNQIDTGCASGLIQLDDKIGTVPTAVHRVANPVGSGLSWSNPEPDQENFLRILSVVPTLAM